MFISYFPTPLPDEAFHSLIARYHLHTFSQNINSSPFSFLRRGSGFIPSHLPTGLQRFVKTISHLSDLDEDHILDNHTIWPFLKKLTSVENRSKLEALMKIDVAIPPFLGKFSLNSAPKYCPLCNSENMSQHGELYWMRRHQLPGINICIKHNCFLEPFFSKSSTQPKIFIPSYESCPNEKPRLNRKKILREVAEFMHQILTDPNVNLDLDYLRLISSHGYNSWYPGDYHALRGALSKFYGKSTIKRYWLSLSGELAVDRSFHERHVQNPVRQVLLQYFFKNHKRKLTRLEKDLKESEEKYERNRKKLEELTTLYKETKSFDVLMQMEEIYSSYIAK